MSNLDQAKLLLQFMRHTMRKSDSVKLWRAYLASGAPYHTFVKFVESKHPDVWFRYQAWKALQ